MNKPEPNIIESVNFLSEETLTVKELDRRLSFNVLDLSMFSRPYHACTDCGSVEICGNVNPPPPGD